MLIHQITQRKKTPLNEGVLDQVKSLGQKGVGALARSKPATSLRNIAQAATSRGRSGSTIDEYKIRQYANNAYNFWKKFTKKYAGSLPDPQDRERYLAGGNDTYRRQLIQFVETNLLRKNPISSFDNSAQIMKIIDELSGVGASTAAPVARQQQVAQPTKSAQPPTKRREVPMVTPRGVKVVSGEPRILSYKNTDFARNDQGEWETLRGNKVGSQQLQAFLDKEDEQLDLLSEGYNGDSSHEEELFVDLVRLSLMGTQSDTQYNRKSNGSSGARNIASGRGKEVNSTGDSSADQVLSKMGYRVKK